MPSDRCVDSALFLMQTAYGDGLVDPRDGVLLQPRCQCQMSLVVLSNNQQAAGVLVNTVNNARANDAAYPRERVAAVQSNALTKVPSGLPAAG